MNAPQIFEYLSEDDKAHFSDVKMHLKDLNIILTGATGGIGGAILEKLKNLERERKFPQKRLY